MKKGLGALLLAVMMVMGIALLTGCSPQNPLVGTWQLTYDGGDKVDSSDVFFTFNKNGQWEAWGETADVEMYFDEQPFGGKYTATEDVVTMIDTNSNKLEYTYKIVGNTMYLTSTENSRDNAYARLVRIQ